MSTSANTAAAVNPNVFDVGSLTALKRQLKDGDPKALKAAAQQFEALFLQMVLKSMRDATPREGLFDSDQSRMYESLLDQQMAQVLGAKSGGTGLAAMIEKQLLRQNPEPQLFDGPLPLHPAAPNFLLPRQRGSLPLSRDTAPALIPLQNVPEASLSAVPSAPTIAPGTATDTQRAFVDRLLPAAVSAERTTGIPAHFMVAQAALETGWGKAELRRADGSPSFNVFGIKAGRNWQGPVVEATTTEYVAGVAQKQVERFRAYGSYAEAFDDYSSLLSANPRYAGVLGAQDASSFARGLQRAGYATDPMYAAKLERIIGGTTLRQMLAG
ncbi:MAG: flagellar assembly peptidoglycan hydrolase FlgJ [Sulfuritalea sp.]|jgi:flagellar protein FlgJ|nr:flagellar assembly peptidoglycan hydrolase FlgJ [Sulfuritalea sp.]